MVNGCHNLQINKQLKYTPSQHKYNIDYQHEVITKAKALKEEVVVS